MKFGFLINNYCVSFDGVTIKPLPEYNESVEKVYTNCEVAGGWIYPPLNLSPEKKDHFEKKFVRSGPILRKQDFTLPVTHSITCNPESCDKTHLYFLVKAYGFLLGRYLLPENHLHFHKTPYTSGKIHALEAKPMDCEVGMETINRFYLSSNRKERNLLFAILHWYSISESYELAWDHFDAQYKVLDAIYRLCREKGFVGKAKAHAKRPIKLANKFGLVLPEWAKIDEDTKESPVQITRNGLVHEALFAGEPIGYSYPKHSIEEENYKGEIEEKEIFTNYRLDFPHFNMRLICALLGLETPYIKVEPHSPADRCLHFWDLPPKDI